MTNLIGNLLFYASRFCMIGGAVLAVVGVVLMVGGILGISTGTTTNIVLFGVTIASSVLGTSAVVVGIVLFNAGLALVLVGLLLWWLLVAWVRETQA